MKISHAFFMAAALLFSALAGVSGGDSVKESDLPPSYRVISPRLRCSAEPVGEKSFAALAKEGVKTIVSVDGSSPDPAAAERAGMKYVHLPIGYDGVPAPVIAALAEVLQGEAGVILIHCHHGKHRGPAAAAIAGMIDGSLTKAEALAMLEKAGTSPDYAGLWRDVRNFDGVPKNVKAPVLKPISNVPPLVTDMVAIDHAVDALGGFAQPGEKLKPAPASAREVLEQCVLLVEGFREATRHVPDQEPNRDELRGELEKTRQKADVILAAARENDLPRAADLLTTLKTDCRTCHRKFRD